VESGSTTTISTSSRSRLLDIGLLAADKRIRSAFRSVLSLQRLQVAEHGGDQL
jgi:hypothetical protein